MSVQNGAMDVRQSDATGRMRLTSVFSPAHVCVHSTTQARSQDFPRGGGSYSGEKWTLSLKGGGSHLVKMGTFVLYPMEPLAQGGGVVRPPPRPPLATGLTWGSGDACDHRHIILLHETCEKMKEPTNMGP